MHGGASGVGLAAELGMEALEPASISANKGMMRENNDQTVAQNGAPWGTAAELVCNSLPGTRGREERIGAPVSKVSYYSFTRRYRLARPTRAAARSTAR